MQFTLNISNKKLLKRILAISLPVLVVGASITTYLVKTNNNDTPVINNITVTNGVKRQVYLINKNNLLTPLTVVIEKKDLLVDELKELVSLLKEESNLKNDNFNKVLNKECDLIINVLPFWGNELRILSAYCISFSDRNSPPEGWL